MATYTISPIPLGGGTITITNDRAAWTQLDTDRYLVVYQQTTPNHVFAQVVTYNGATTAPTLGTARLVRQNLAALVPQVRVIGLGASKAVIFYTTSTGVVESQFVSIDAANNVTESAAATFIADGGYNTSVQYTTSFAKLSDTTIRLFYNNFARTNVHMHNVTVNAAMETLTLGSPVDSFGGGTYSYFIAPVPGTSNFYEAAMYRSGSNNYPVTRIIGPTGQTVATVDTSAWYAPQACPVSATRSFFVRYQPSVGMSVYVIDNGVQATPVLCTANTINPVSNVLPLDDHHVMAIADTSAGLSAMVMRLLSAGIGDVSTATNKAGGLAMNMSGLSSGFTHFSVAGRYHPSYVKRDDSTYVYWFVNSNKLGFKSIYQPAS